MKGCGGKIFTFIVGMLTGIVLFVGSICGVVYWGLTAATIGELNEKTIKTEAIPAESELSGMTLLAAFQGVGKLLGNPEATLGDFNTTFGIDLVAILDKALGGLSDTAVYVKASDVSGYDGATSIDQYIVNAAGADFEVLGSAALGTTMTIVAVDGKNVFRITKNEVSTDYSTKYTIENGVAVESESGTHIKIIDGAKSKLSATKLVGLTSNLDVLIDCFTLNSIFSLANISESTLPMLASRQNLPVTLALNEIVGVFNNINTMTLRDLQGEIGVTFYGQIFDALMDTTIGGLGEAINDLPLSQILPDLDRDIYVKVADADGALTSVEAYYGSVDGINLKKFADLTATNIRNFEGNLQYNTGKEGAAWENVDKGLKFAIANGKLAEAADGVYYRVHLGQSTAVLKALADSTLNTMDTTVNGLKLSEVIEMDLDRFTIVGDTVGVTDFYILTDGKYVRFDENNAAHAAVPVEKRYFRSHAGTTNIILQKLANLTVGNLDGKIQEVIDDIELDELINLADDEYTLVAGGNDAAYTGRYYMIIEDANGNDIYVRWQDGYVLNGEVITDKYMKTINGSSPVLLKIRRIKVGELGTKMQDLIDEMLMYKVIEIDANLYREASTAEIATADPVEKAKLFVRNDDIGGRFQMYLEYDPTNPLHTAANVKVYYKYHQGVSPALLQRLAYVSIIDIEDAMDLAIKTSKLKDLELNVSAGSFMAEESIQNATLDTLGDTITTTMYNASLLKIVEWGNFTINPQLKAVLQAMEDDEKPLIAKDFFNNLTYSDSGTPSDKTDDKIIFNFDDANP